MKSQSVFYPARLVETAKANAAKYPWAAEMQKQVVEAAKPWSRFSDDELWELMFGHTITRSWMVWTTGYCPVCKEAVPMYGWEFDAFERPWKARCPHCGDLFPKNDFHGFYRSGLDEHGVFTPQRADRSLLFNTEHPDPQDPLHTFGVDDGEGYVEGDKRWRFIGAYLVYGQWKQAIQGGIKRLSAAYTVTGDPLYAHQAGVLLDRVADLYPTFDWAKEGLAYEKPHGPGYVSTWHDACIETREIALAYDQVFEALREDKELVTFLSHKAQIFQLDNPKASFADIQRNIEDRILRDALGQPPTTDSKILCNFPQTDVTVAILKMILGWPGNRDEVYAVLDPVIEKATEFDGLTGEKGLTNYSTWTFAGLAVFLEQAARVDPAFLKDLLERHSQLRETYRFHIDTWCLQKYYPLVGDCGWFTATSDQYQCLRFQRSGLQAEDHMARFDPAPPVSMYSFLWRLYQLTGDVGYVQVLYRANDNRVEDLPYDLFVDDPAAIQQAVAEVIAREGLLIKLSSINKQKWHLAILRSGQGSEARAAWLHYDCRKGHGHSDGLNLGLFAKGLDLIPDFGYPPTQYGGWDSPQARWYKMAAAHNLIVVDGQNQSEADGATTLWADGKGFRAIRVSGPDLIGGKQYERTIAMIDISERDFYLVDVFRVIGGTDHAKFMRSHFGQITTQGLVLTPTSEYGHDTLMRNFRVDAASPPGWSVDWKIEDRNRLLPSGSEVHLRYTDLTTNVHAFTAESWIANVAPTRIFNAYDEEWIPTVMVRRQTQVSPLASTFVAVIEPYDMAANIGQIRRLSLETLEGAEYPDANLAVEIRLADGRRDLFLAVDVENPLGLTPSKAESKIVLQPDWGLRFDGEMLMARRGVDGEVQQLAVCRGSSVSIEEVVIKLRQDTAFVEASFDGSAC